MLRSLVRTSFSKNNNNIRQQYFTLVFYSHNCVKSVCAVIITLVHLTDTFKVNIEISCNIFKSLVCLQSKNICIIMFNY